MILEPVALRGEHVSLEPLRAEHRDHLLAAASEDRSSYGFTWVPADRNDADAYIAKALDDAARGVSMPFVQRRLDRGVICGSTRFLNIETWGWAEGNGWPDVAEIGSTWLASSAQRTAINTEAKLLLMTHAFEVWRVERLWIKTDAMNLVSRTAIERLGAQFEGILRRQMPAFGRPGARDTASYSVTPHEWPAIKQRLIERIRGSSAPSEPGN